MPSFLCCCAVLYFDLASFLCYCVSFWIWRALLPLLLCSWSGLLPLLLCCTPPFATVLYSTLTPALLPLLMCSWYGLLPLLLYCTTAQIWSALLPLLLCPRLALVLLVDLVLLCSGPVLWSNASSLLQWCGLIQHLPAPCSLVTSALIVLNSSHQSSLIPTPLQASPWSPSCAEDFVTLVTTWYYMQPIFYDALFQFWWSLGFGKWSNQK